MQAKNKKRIEFLPILATIVWITNIIALVLLLASLLTPYVSSEKTTIFAFIGLGFPIILLINIAYLVLWIIFQKWKLTLITAIALCLCWKPISTYFAFSASSKEVPTDAIKILSYNVKAFDWKLSGEDFEKNECLKYIEESGADIVCMQEYLVFKTNASKKLKIDPTIRRIMKDYPYYKIVNPTESQSNYIYGLACFSKFPIENTYEISLGSKSNGMTLYHINIRGKVISLVNVHLESNKITSEDKALYRKLFKNQESTLAIFDDVARNMQSRLGVAYKKRSRQADIIAEYVEAEKAKTDGIIICGDFNDTPISYVYQTVKGDLKDSFLETGTGTGITYHENKFLFRIDFILHSENIKAYNFKVDKKTKASDHYPVWTYLEMPK